MAELEAAKSLTEECRREIFLALVEAQDHEMSVVQSRKHVTDRFSISDEQVRLIEREGMDQQWPPLG